MSEPDHKPPTDKVAGQAADWFVRLHSDRAGEEDWLAFNAWLAESPAHLEAYERLERIAAELDELAPEAPDCGATIVPLPVRAPQRAASSWFLWVAAAAAVLAVAVAAPLLRSSPGPVPATAETYAAARGQTRLVQLADGTRVVLGSASAIHVGFETGVRRVTMDPGEAIFDVAKDPGRPFLIAVGDQEVRVVGTEFNILRLLDRTLVTVRRGVVAVGARGAAPEARLIRGQQLEHRDGVAASTIRTTDPDQSFSWRSGRIVYDDRPLVEVVADLNRYFATPIRLGDPAVGRIRFTGVIVIDSEDVVVRRLQGLLPVRIEQSQDAVVLWSSAR